MTDGALDTGLFRAIVEGAPEAIIASDPNGVIRLWNAGAEAIVGYPAHEAVCQRLDLMIPERYRERHWAGYRTVMQTGTTSYGGQLLAVPALRKDGTRISIEFHVVVLRDPPGSVAGVAAIVRMSPSDESASARYGSGFTNWRRPRPSRNGPHGKRLLRQARCIRVSSRPIRREDSSLLVLPQRLTLAWEQSAPASTACSSGTFHLTSTTPVPRVVPVRCACWRVNRSGGG